MLTQILAVPFLLIQTLMEKTLGIYRSFSISLEPPGLGVLELGPFKGFAYHTLAAWLGEKALESCVGWLKCLPITPNFLVIVLYILKYKSKTYAAETQKKHLYI